MYLSMRRETHDVKIVNQPDPFTAPSTTWRSNVHRPLALAIVPPTTVAPYSSST